MSKVLYNESYVASKPGKAREDKRIGGRLENWEIILYPTGHHVIVGYVYGDNAWREGQDIRTSVLVSVDEEDGVAETLNTIYTLGKKAERVALSEEQKQAAADFLANALG